MVGYKLYRQLRFNSMAIYLVGATLTFSTCLNAFLKDSSTSKTDLNSWLVLLFATALWPVALPSVVRKKLAGVTLQKSLSVKTDAIASEQC